LSDQDQDKVCPRCQMEQCPDLNSWSIQGYFDSMWRCCLLQKGWWNCQNNKRHTMWENIDCAAI